MATLNTQLDRVAKFVLTFFWRQSKVGKELYELLDTGGGFWHQALSFDS